MVTSEPPIHSKQGEIRKARLVEDYHGNYGCIVRLSEAQLAALGVNTDGDMVKYAVIEGALRIE